MKHNSTDEWLKSNDSEFLMVLRALSIFIIVFGHVGGFWIYRPWSEFLHVFVPIFFFISGATSYDIYQKKKKIKPYLIKRVTSLVAPYYSFCIFVLAIYIFIYKKLPQFNFNDLISWLTVSPGSSLMPFPLGQVWFLHTLILIGFMSPVFFIIYNRSIILFQVFMIIPFILSLLQLKHNLALNLILGNHNLFRPLIHSLFFCIGFVVFDNSKLRNKYFSIVVIFIFILLSVLLVKLLNLNPDYADHIYSPDLYYVAGSIASIWIFVFLQPWIMIIYSKLHLFKKFIEFFFRHTFAIYLLHTFSIFFVEEVFGLAHPQQKVFLYAISKLSLVFAITLALSPIFTKASRLITKLVINFIDGPKSIFS